MTVLWPPPPQASSSRSRWSWSTRPGRRSRSAQPLLLLLPLPLLLLLSVWLLSSLLSLVLLLSLLVAYHLLRNAATGRGSEERDQRDGRSVDATGADHLFGSASGGLPRGLPATAAAPAAAASDRAADVRHLAAVRRAPPPTPFPPQTHRTPAPFGPTFACGRPTAAFPGGWLLLQCGVGQVRRQARVDRAPGPRGRLRPRGVRCLLIRADVSFDPGGVPFDPGGVPFDPGGLLVRLD